MFSVSGCCLFQCHICVHFFCHIQTDLFLPAKGHLADNSIYIYTKLLDGQVIEHHPNRGADVTGSYNCVVSANAGIKLAVCFVAGSGTCIYGSILLLKNDLLRLRGCHQRMLKCTIIGMGSSS